MPQPTTWTAGLFGAGAGADDLAEAERNVAILKAELEAIRGGRKEASASELRKLERDYRDAVAKVQQLRVTARPTAAPRPSVTPRPTLTPTPPMAGAPTAAPRRVPTPVGTPPPPAPVGGVGGAFGVTTPRGYTARVGPAPGGGVGAVPGGVTTPRGYAAPPAPGLRELWQGRPRVQAGPGVRPPGAIPGASALAFGQGQPARPTMSPDVLRALTGGAQGMMGLIGQRLGLDRLAQGAQPMGGGADTGGCAFMYMKPMEEWTPAERARYPQCLRESQQTPMTEYQAGSLEQQRAEAQALQAYRMAQLGQGQATAAATAAYQQQQAEQAKAQLMQAWAIAQQELAHAQNVMASQIGTQVAGLQSQIWAQGLPHALPQGTQVAPGFERGGPMSQLYRMSGSQFRPGTTGRISPYPGPSQQQLMGTVASAMGRYGAGR